MSVVLKIHSFADGSPSPWDNTYVVEYDPSRQGYSPNGTAPIIAYLTTTPDINLATHYVDVIEALCVYQQKDGLRDDGKPNRPITALTVEFLRFATNGADER